MAIFFYQPEQLWLPFLLNLSRFIHLKIWHVYSWFNHTAKFNVVSKGRSVLCKIKRSYRLHMLVCLCTIMTIWVRDCLYNKSRNQDFSYCRQHKIDIVIYSKFLQKSSKKQTNIVSKNSIKFCMVLNIFWHVVFSAYASSIL